MSEYTAEDMRRDLALTREELEYLRGENDRLERVLQDPLLLKGLEAAWENAEQAPECRKGDVLIVPGSWGGYTIWEARRDAPLRAARILSRAPKLERMALAQVVAFWRPGSHDWTWAEEHADVMARPETPAIRKRVQEEGIGFQDDVAPILLGNDGRVWDGHHRICIALELGVDSVNVERAGGGDNA